MLDTLLALGHRLSRYSARAGGGMILFAAFMVTVDVLSRRIFGITMSESDEVSGYLFAIATALAMPYARLMRANVRIDAAYNLLLQRVRYAMDLFGLILFTLFTLLVSWRAALTVQVPWDNDAQAITPLHTPLILPQSIWLAGWVLFCLRLVLVLAGTLRADWRGDLAAASQLSGVMSVEEEVAEETAGVLPIKVKEA